MLVADDVRTNEQTTGRMAAHGCHLVVCSLCLFIVNIEIRSFILRALTARTALYKTGPLVLSRLFLLIALL